MTVMRAFYHLLNVNLHFLSKKEKTFLEVDLFTRICEELKEIISNQKKDYFRFMKFNKETENTMLEANLVCFIINDILSTEEYNLRGIACYTGFPEDIIYDVAAGCNLHPSLTLARKIIDLHRIVRPNIYRDIINKITNQLSPPD